MGMIRVYLLGKSSHVSAMTNLKGTHALMPVLKRGEKRKMMKLLESISKLVSKSDIPEI